MMQAMRKWYRWLYEEARVMHRDISLGNLMFRIKDNQVVGVLSEYGLSLRLDTFPAPTSKQRIGTMPFMAADLLVLEPPPHLYRYDLESL
ncbi:hypothetical protein B0H17DRAFT_1058733 [Mycena rosella]|uniref:Protein kinase domain-containing protein n=1 Tax=Mycena rosella TaxID=1033263 RepID=A0AAD7GLV5_MYCRO|nr:hypothetical protein B0H17DRAFT_1058733 [Mycena rosella]